MLVPTAQQFNEYFAISVSPPLNFILNELFRYDYCLLLRDTLNSVVDNTNISEQCTSSIIRESYIFKLEAIGYSEISVLETRQHCIQGDIRPIFRSHLHGHLNSHTTAYSLLLFLLLLLSNFSFLSFSWETYTYPGICTQQD
jgi:hypothetical protein